MSLVEGNFFTVKDRKPAIVQSQEKDRGQKPCESTQHRVPVLWQEAGTQDGDEIKLAEIQVGDDILEMYGNEIKVAETQVRDQILEMCGGNHIKFAETQVGH